MAYRCRIEADSLAPCGERLTTFVVTYPRIVLAEKNTHRELSRGGASSRAIPVRKRIEAVMLDPFIPEAFSANAKGMYSGGTIDASDNELAREIWYDAMRDAVKHAGRLAAIDVHKEHANRLLEPFVWQTAVVSATQWQNFFGLRVHKNAAPEMRMLATMMLAHYVESTPVTKHEGEWHLPFTTAEERDVNERLLHDNHALVKVSAARCARVSYETHEGVRSIEEDLKLYHTKLHANGHMGPLEHPAMALAEPARFGNFVGWKQLRKFIPNEHDFSLWRGDDNPVDMAMNGAIYRKDKRAAELGFIKPYEALSREDPFTQELERIRAMTTEALEER